MSEAALLIFFPALMAFSAASDLITMRISNRISIALIVGFLAFAFLNDVPLTLIGWHFVCGFMVLVICIALWAFRVMGGGDAKLIAATSVWFGFADTFEYTLAASLLGGLVALLFLNLRRLPAPQIVRDTPWLFKLHNPKEKLPFGLALGAAGLLVLPQSAIWTMMAA